MKVLVACEYSGTVRDAFIARGHDAMSCDLLPTDAPGPHYQGNVFDIINDGWDLMIAHPPCTYLTVSGNKWLKDQPSRKSGVLVGEQRRKARVEALAFVYGLWKSIIPMVCIENPIGVLSSLFRKPDQVIQPWMFGHGETKATCFWLRGLPLLQPTHRDNDLFCKPEPMGRLQRLHLLPPSADRWKIRSKTYQGIADAMAEQWGEISC
jgi:hypothetical protein